MKMVYGLKRSSIFKLILSLKARLDFPNIQNILEVNESTGIE